MRRAALVLLLMCALTPLSGAEAVFYNDSNVIEIGDGTPPEPEEGEGSGVGGGEEDAGSGQQQGTNIPHDSEGADAGGSQGGGSSSGGGSGGGGSSSGGSPASEEEQEAELLEILISEGALAGVSGNGTEGGAGSGSALGSFGVDSVLNVSVSGAKVRSALRGNYDLRDVLDRWSAKGRGKFSSEEYGLMAASTAMRDGNVESVSFTASAFELTYRSRGYLLAVIPWSFPVRVRIVPEAPSLAERVNVRLPWYRFFLREFFTIDGLTREIDTVITTTMESNAGPDSDGTALLFIAVSEHLRQKVGTIQESVTRSAPAE